MEEIALGFPLVTTKVGGIPYLFADEVDAIMKPTDYAQAMIDPILEFVNALKYVIDMARKARNKAEG